MCLNRVPYDFLPESFFYKYINAWANITFAKFEQRKNDLKAIDDRAKNYDKLSHEKTTGNRDLYHSLAQNATQAKAELKKKYTEEQKLANFQIKLFSKISGRVYDFFINLADKLTKRAQSTNKMAILMSAITFSDVTKFAIAQKPKFVKLFKTKKMQTNAAILYDAMLLYQDADGNSYDDSMSYSDISEEQALQDMGCDSE